MTLSDLFKLIRHYLRFMIAVPVICVVATVLITLLMPQTYEAKASLLTNGDIALASGFAQSEAEALTQDGITVSTKIDASSLTITAIAEGNDYNGCIMAANATVNATANDIQEVNSEFAISTNEAVSAENTSPSILKFALIALLAGIFLAICIILIIDAVKKPIKSKDEVEAVAGISVIGDIPSRDRGERLLANVRFASEGLPSTVAIIPAGLTGMTLVCAELTSAFEHSGITARCTKGDAHAEGLGNMSLPGVVTIVECPPLSEGMGSLYIAREADLTVLCAQEWVDSREALTNVVRELEFAKANIAGVVFLSAK